MQLRKFVWVLVVGLASVVFWQAAHSAQTQDDDAELYRLFVDALEHVDRNYVKKVDRRQLVESAIVGMLNELDPYSNFIAKEEFKQFDRTTKGKFGGIGVQISMKDGVLTVMSPLVGTPAYEAGIIAGDRILEVNGQNLRGWTLNDIVDKLTGPAGSEVTLKVQHPPYDQPPVEITLKRANINVESVLGDTHGPSDEWDFMLDKENKIGYIRINSFIQDTKDNLQAAIDKLLKEGMKGLILDLRYNPGGLLSSAIEVSDLFVGEGTIVSTKGRTSTDKTYEARKEGTLPDFPMVVLVNGFSASASEIVAACLQDHERATVIGERTWGKGSVQNVIELEGGESALKLTTAAYRRPNGHNIHRFEDSKEEDEWGVSPNKGFDVKFSKKDHNVYQRWRFQKDQIVGKRKSENGTATAAPVEPKEEPKADGKEGAKPDEKPVSDEKKDEPKKDEKSVKPNSEGNDSESGDELSIEDATDEEVKNFKDPQLAKALDFLKSELTKTAKKDG
ncbi:MAG: S41 family peptidase [Planctomycetota bacterium]